MHPVHHFNVAAGKDNRAADVGGASGGTHGWKRPLTKTKPKHRPGEKTEDLTRTLAADMNNYICVPNHILSVDCVCILKF